jgi:hypothetical protein
MVLRQKQEILQSQCKLFKAHVNHLEKRQHEWTRWHTEAPQGVTEMSKQLAQTEQVLEQRQIKDLKEQQEMSY